MAWTSIPVSVGDEIKIGQLTEVRNAILERQQVVGGSAPQAVNVGDALLASIINEYRGEIDSLIPDFIDETSGNYWTKADLFENLFGSGRTDWLRRPARDPAGATQGALQSGDICYIEHINEMHDVLNKLAWFEVLADDYEDENYHSILEKGGGSGRQATRSEAVDEFWSSLLQSGISSRPTVTPLLHVHFRYRENTDPYAMDGDLRRAFAVVNIPDYPVDIMDAKALVEITSNFEDAIDGNQPFNSYAAKLFGSTTSPGILGEGDWAFGAEVASVNVNDLGGTEIIAFDHAALEEGANFYIQERGKDTCPNRLKTANWYKPPEPSYAGDGVSHLILDVLFLKLNFEYK